jgi:hypothetical protein
MIQSCEISGHKWNDPVSHTTVDMKSGTVRCAEYWTRTCDECGHVQKTRLSQLTQRHPVFPT